MTPTYYATRDFKDAGTEKAFKRGDDLSAEPGVANYAAAELVSTEKPVPIEEIPAASVNDETPAD